MAIREYVRRLHRRRPSPLIVSFPKSGRSWYLVLLDELNLKIRVDHAGSDLKLEKHWADLDTKAANGYSRIVLLVRDPRDAVVSAYYHLRDRKDRPYEGSMSDFVRDPRFGFEKAIRFNLMWSEFLSGNGGLVVSYEDTHADACKTLEHVTAYFEHRCAEDKIADVARRNGFAEMRGREERGDFEDRFPYALGATRSGDFSFLKLRKGQVGGYKDDLNEANLAYCKVLFRDLNYFDRLDGWKIPRHQSLRFD